MKFILLSSFLITSSFICCEAKVVTLNIPDGEIKIVENDVIDAEQWIKDAWAGKVANCKKRLIKSEVDRSIRDKEAIPAGDDAIVQKAFARPDYQSRKQRDAETAKVRSK